MTAEQEVEVRPLVGEAVTGLLTALSAKNIAVETPTGSREFDNSKLMWLQVSGVAPMDKAAIWIDLADGSKLAASAFVAAKGIAHVTIVGRQPLEIPTRSIRTVRFRQQTREISIQWRELTSSQASGDMIVMRKTSTRTIEQGENEPRTVTEQALDQLE